MQEDYKRYKRCNRPGSVKRLLSFEINRERADATSDIGRALSTSVFNKSPEKMKLILTKPENVKVNVY